MTDRIFWPLFFLGVVTLACIFGVVHCAIEAAISRHLRRAEQRELFRQPSHVRTIPSPREGSSHR
jgi:hypothetical protein